MANATKLRWLVAALLVAGSTGCQETRFLSCQTRDPRVEARSYDLHDPFPDEDIGPETFVRPRTFEEPRSEPRKSFDLRNLLASGGVVRPPEIAWVPQSPIAGAPLQPVWRQPPPGVPLTTPPGFWDAPTRRYQIVRP